MLQSDATLYRGSIDNSIPLALSCLRGHFRTVQSGPGAPVTAAGWYHYLDDPNPGITASAVGLYCFSLAYVDFEWKHQVLDSSWANRYKTPSSGGGWAVRTTNDFPIVEATAWVVRCRNLPQTRTRATRGALDSGIEWLEANQNTDYGWGSYKGQPSRLLRRPCRCWPCGKEVAQGPSSVTHKNGSLNPRTHRTPPGDQCPLVSRPFCIRASHSRPCCLSRAHCLPPPSISQRNG